MVDISILKKRPNNSVSVLLEIEPLAPLSMVNDLPGGYYKSLTTPTKKMLCGLMENILFWHFDVHIRKKIISDLKKLRKKQQITYNNQVKGSDYIPLLIEYFEITCVDIPKFTHYDDLFNRFYNRKDSKDRPVHAKGTKNIDSSLIPIKKNLNRDKDGKIIESDLANLFSNNLSKFPNYYSIPTNREYIYTNDKFKIEMMMDNILFIMFNNAIKTNNYGYLGNSDGWVHLKLTKV